MFRKKLFLVAVVALVTLAACSGSAAPPSDPGSGSGQLGLPADFRIEVYQGQDLLGGREVNFSDLFDAGRPVVLNAWAGLCPPCRLEMPDFQEAYDAYGDRVLLLGLDVGPFVHLGTRDDGRALLRELGVTYPAGSTPQSEVVGAYQIIGMPTTFFIKPDGEIHRRWTGLLTQDKLSELMQELLEVSRGA
jgi:thiol-disulfide isomerase/thioredoxin